MRRTAAARLARDFVDGACRNDHVQLMHLRQLPNCAARPGVAALLLLAAPPARAAAAVGPLSLPPEFRETLMALATAFVLGTAIGLERQWRQRSAGLRTTVLVALGSAAFADLGARLLGADGATRLISYVVSGIGFLGAGVILKEGANIRGLNTAATLWCSAAVGAFCGSGLIGEAVVVGGFVLGANTLLRPLVNAVNRRPLESSGTEAYYRVHAICDFDAVTDVRDLMTALLESVHYPVRDIETLSEGDGRVELAANLIAQSANPADLDNVVAALERSAKVRSATWSVSAVP
jgi:putative Mg2+ transporter-C (MgtC) family protein